MSKLRCISVVILHELHLGHNAGHPLRHYPKRKLREICCIVSIKHKNVRYSGYMLFEKFHRSIRRLFKFMKYVKNNDNIKTTCSVFALQLFCAFYCLMAVPLKIVQT